MELRIYMEIVKLDNIQDIDKSRVNTWQKRSPTRKVE